MTEYRAIIPLAALLVTGCAVGPPSPSTAQPHVAATIVEATAPDRPLRVVFAWEGMEGDARFTGQGVARIEPPYQARLDLFGPRGDTYLSAALVGADLRLPPGVQGPMIPPPALMWAVLGVVAPPANAVLVGTREQADQTELYYEVGGGTLWYILYRGRLRTVRWDEPGRRLAVELRGEMEPRLPARAVYQDPAAVAELMLNLERVDEVEPFPPDIWTPGR